MLKKIKNAKKMRENYKKYFFNGRNRKKKRKNTYILYATILYICFLKFRKKL
jgi:hypothetical protein